MFIAAAKTIEPETVVYEAPQEVATTTDVVIVEESPKEDKVIFDNAVLKAICACESDIFGRGEPQHYELDGVTVITGRVDSRDTGMCQINKGYHLETATRLGYDINTPQGNWNYAKYLYDTQGVQPWRASEHCWSKKLWMKEHN